MLLPYTIFQFLADTRQNSISSTEDAATYAHNKGHPVLHHIVNAAPDSSFYSLISVVS